MYKNLQPNLIVGAYPIALSGMAAPMLDMHAYEETELLVDDYGELA